MAAAIMTLEDIRRELGHYLAWGSDDAAWTADEVSRMAWIISSGLRQFYYPPALPGQNRAHQWSFLRVSASISAVANDAEYDLPADFGALDGPVTFDGTGLATSKAIEIVGEGYIRRLQQMGLRCGRPTRMAVRQKAFTGTAAVAYEAVLWPTPDQAYTILYRYRVLWAEPDDTHLHLLGAADHGETILASCMAVAEERIFNTRGLKYQMFIERLTASISLDMEQGGEYLGYNRDGSDGGRRTDWSRGDYVTINGVLPDGEE